MGYLTTSALVLRVIDYSESDKLVTFFSHEFGRATGIAKGAKKSKIRFVNKLELFSFLTLTCRQNRNNSLLFLSEAELNNSFLPLRQDYNRFSVATLIVELVMRLTREHDPDQNIFTLLLWAFSSLEKTKSPLQVAVLFHLRLMELTGYRPELEKCGQCGKKTGESLSFTLHPSSGTLVCKECSRTRGFGQATTFSLQTIKFLQKGQSFQLQQLDRLHLSPNAIREALLLLYRYTRHLLQQDIHSYKVVRELFK